MLCVVVILELRCSFEPLVANFTPVLFLDSGTTALFWAVEVAPS